MTTIFMKSKRLWFRPLELADAAWIVPVVNLPEVRQNLDHRVFPINELCEEQWIRNQKADGSVKDSVIFGYGRDGTHALIGLSGLHEINWIARKAIWGILIAPEHQNQGFGREVAERMVQYAFEELNLDRVELEVVACHAAAIKCYQNAGFIPEGRHRKCFWRDGKLEDTIPMAKLRNDAPEPEETTDLRA